MRDFLIRHLPGKWELAGWVLVGLAAACFEKHGLDQMADAVWQESVRTVPTTPGDVQGK